jgi:hypothetical protein
MKKIIVFSLFTALVLMGSAAIARAEGKAKIILLISEQNIEAPRTAWWATEVDLSATEAAIAAKLIEAGYEILEPAQLEGVVKKTPAFRMLDLGEKDAVKMGNLSKADYVLAGKAVASSGASVPQSNMRSCFANLTAKLIRVKDNKVVAYLDAAGNSAHPDQISGGREALVNAAANLSAKIIEALNKQ